GCRRLQVVAGGRRQCRAELFRSCCRVELFRSCYRVELFSPVELFRSSCRVELFSPVEFSCFVPTDELSCFSPALEKNIVMSETHSEKRKFGKAGESSVNKKARREVSKKYGKFTEDCIPDGVFPI
ncbi:hypothetical protein TNCV_1801991, partial [Trichonephila clavipes]